jgi:SAM-dependent methyltransferase
MAPDVWAAGGAYEFYIGRWSRPVAREFLAWLGVPAGRRWLDVGCGTGALTGAVLAAGEPARVLGVDPATGFLAHARATVTDPRAAFCAGDARALPVPDGWFDAVVTGLALNFVPDPARAATELARVARDGAVVAGYVWDYGGGMGMLRHFWSAAAELDPDAADEARRFPLCAPDPLRTLWTDAGLRDVTVTGIEVPTTFASLDDYWQPFLGGQGPAPGYVAGLSDERRDALRELLRSRVPLSLTARAWAVRGIAVAHAAP